MIQLYRTLNSFWEEGFLNRFFIVFIIVGILPFLFFEKGQEILLLNRYSHPSIDDFIVNFTHMGNGLVWLFIAVIFVFIRFSAALTALFVLIFNGLFIFVFKKLLFNGMPRPTAFLPTESFYHFIEGFTYHTSNSFPSGHTMTAFSVAFFLSYYLRDVRVSVLLMIYAVLIGFSRMYLLLHFYVDIYVGVIMGLMCFLAARYVTEEVLLLHKRKAWSHALRLIVAKPREAIVEAGA
ncbi:MAG: phosphatase PAP2 family protein [Bacteroidales bacterium]